MRATSLGHTLPFARGSAVCCFLFGCLPSMVGCVQSIKEENPTSSSKSVGAASNASKPAVANPPNDNQAKTANGGKGAQTAAAPSAGARAAEAADEPARQPATVAEAVQVLDLATFPLLPGAKDPGTRIVASLAYEAPGDVKSAYEFQRRNLLDRGWKELSEPQIFDQSGSGQFGREGYHVSVSIFPHGEPGKVAVRLQNHSNVNLSKLPVPPGAKLQYAFPGVASFVTSAGVDETAAAVRKLLLEQGWQPYGSAGDSMHLKQNAVELNARVLAPPAQPGTTVIDYSATLLSTDLPAPPDAESVQYADSIKQLNVEALGTPDEVVAFYKSALAPAGWKPTTDNRITDRFESFLIFRNAAKDMLTLTMRDLTEKKMTRVTLKHQSAAEVEELDRQIELATAERKKKEEAERNKPKPKAVVTLPAGAREVQATAQEIEFKLATGQAKAALAAIAKELAAAGWKSEERIGEDAGGQLSFKKGDWGISVLYVDPGFIPAEITISGSGVDLERGAAETP
jgi:hypothetical protein